MKRANGTGTVVKLSGPRRRPWAVRVSVRDPAGHIVQRVLGCYEKSAEAQAALDAYNRSVAEGGAPLRDVSFATLGEVFEAWSAREYRKLKPASIQSHNAAWRQRVSRLSDRRIRSITAFVCSSDSSHPTLTPSACARCSSVRMEGDA